MPVRFFAQNPQKTLTCGDFVLKRDVSINILKYEHAEPVSRGQSRDKAMFNDLFDFSKKRTLKQSVGFFIFHSGVILVVFAAMSAAGIS